MTESEAAWLAGFLDGEGSFMVTRSARPGCVAPFYEAVVSASNTDHRLIQRCVELAGGKVAAVKARNQRHKDSFVWQLHGRSVGPLIESVIPFLVGKREQASLLLRLRAMTKNGSPKGRFSTRKTPEEVAARSEIHAEVRLLNRRGNPKYAQMAERRIHDDAPLFAPVTGSTP